MCVHAVRNARVPGGMTTRSRKPASPAAPAPSSPAAISHCEPWTRNPGLLASCDATSKPRLITHAPIGTVTSMGWYGCP